MATAEFTDDKDLQAASVEFDDSEQAISSKDKQSLIQGKKHPGIETVPLRDSSYQHETVCGFDGLKVIVVSAIIFAFGILVALIITILIGEPQVQPHGAVACSSQQCSYIGKNILKEKGGSAVDAALATLICLGVVDGHLSGLGGGGFMLVRESKAEAPMAFDFRETAPSNSSATMYANNTQRPLRGGISVGVPGELRGMKKAHEQYGKVSWQDLFHPSIQLARHGFQVTGSLADVLENIPLEDMPARMKEVYAPGGIKVTKGQTITRPKLANLLEKIGESREEGVNLFYQGDVADEIINAVQAQGGIMMRSDLSGYQVKSVSTIAIEYDGYLITSLPAPCGGPFVLSALNIMEGYNITKLDKTSPLYYHRLVETFNFVTAMGSRLGDPAFNSPEIQNITTEMLSDARAALIRDAITDDQTHNSSYYFENQAGVLESFGTSHVSVMDNENNMVSVTSTVNNGFGSLVMTESGIILNNEMYDFDWEGKSAEPVGQGNLIEPLKRPQSHMAPVIAWNMTNVCSRKMAIGGTNGSRIWTGITQVILHLLGFRDSVEDAIRPMTRVHDPLIPNQVEAEDGLDDSIIQGLKDRGHKVVIEPEGLSSVHVVMKESDKLYCYGDNRTIGAGSSQF